MTRILTDIIALAFMVWAVLILPPYIEQRRAPDPPAARPQPSPAPIWSARCTRAGKTMVAHQADGGPWVVQCTDPAVKS